LSDASPAVETTHVPASVEAPVVYSTPAGPWLESLPALTRPVEADAGPAQASSNPRSGMIQFTPPLPAPRASGSSGAAAAVSETSASQYHPPAPVSMARAQSASAGGRSAARTSDSHPVLVNRPVVRDWVDPNSQPDASGMRVFRSSKGTQAKPDVFVIANTPETPKRLRDKDKEQIVPVGPFVMKGSLGDADRDWYTDSAATYTQNLNSGAADHRLSNYSFGSNEAQIILHAAGQEGDASITTLWRGDTEIPRFPPEHTLIEAWKVDENIQFASADLLVEYNDLEVMKLQKPEQYLKLWVYRDGWTRIMDSSFGRDMSRNVLWGNTGDGFTYIAVSAPEPAGVLAVLMTTCALTLRRRTHPVPSPLGGEG
jgi:hypothetical protein